MRYQQYKNKMLKIRKVIDFFYRFRFVFAGAITAIVATSITLDVTKGNITQTAEFQVSYVYGEEINPSGKAFMGSVTYEYRRKDEDTWTEDVPKDAGVYYARAKSKGNHGYKYSKESEFEIKQYETTLNLKYNEVKFGVDNPELDIVDNITFRPGDHLADNYIVNYDSKVVKETVARLDLNTVHIVNSNNDDVTANYHITTEPKDITFIPQKLVFDFKDPGVFTYTGDEAHPFTGDEYDPKLIEGCVWYGAHPQITGSSRVNVGSEVNHHDIAIVDDEGNDYTLNYDIEVKENNLVVQKAAPLIITTTAPAKTYNNKPFDPSEFDLHVEGLLENIHEIRDVEFKHSDVVTVQDTLDENGKPIKNEFTYKLVDKRTEEEITDPREFYQDFQVIVNSIEIHPIEVTVTSPTISETYINKPIKGYKEGDAIDYQGQLVEGDYLKVVDFNTQTNPGVYDNHYECQVFRKVLVNDVEEEINVSDNYTIKYEDGLLNIKVDKLVIKFEGQTLPYNGQDQLIFKNSNEGQLVSGMLPEGWGFSAVVYQNPKATTLKAMTMKTANDTNTPYTADETNVKFSIWDEKGDPVTSQYRVDETTSVDNNDNCDVTFIFEKSYVEKVPLNIVVSDFSDLTFNNKTLEQNLDLKDCVSHTGLQTGDEVRIDYLDKSDDSVKNSKNASEDLYSIGLDVGVYYEGTEDSAAGNYSITYNRVPQTTNVKINKKYIHVHTPSFEQIYDDSNELELDKIAFTDIREQDDITPIDYLTVSFDKTKSYFAPSKKHGKWVYTDFDETDLNLYYKEGASEQLVHDWTSLDNYVVDLVEDGEVDIKPRPIDIYQKEDTIDYIYYDGQEHGVFTGSNEVKYSDDDFQDNAGLLKSKSHTLSFSNTFSRSDENAHGDAALYGNGLTNAEKTAYYGTTIRDSALNDVTDDYDINYTDDYFKINIIKKYITIKSGSGKKVFDGSALDLYEGIPEDTWIDVDLMNTEQFETTKVRWDDKQNKDVPTEIDDNHKIQVKKTKNTTLEDSKNVGTYANEFDWQVVKVEGKNEIPLPDDYYHVTTNYGSLQVKKLWLDVMSYGDSTKYNGQDITFPNGHALDDYSGYSFDVNDSSSNKIAYFEFRQVPDDETPQPNDYIPFDREEFFKNFEVKGAIYKRTYDKYYISQTYNFDVVLSAYIKGTNTSYTNKDNFQLSTESFIYNHYVYNIKIELKSVKASATTELRVIVGTLASGDVLYFGTEKYTTLKPQAWKAAFIRENVHIYRGDNKDDEVTNCYDITMK